MEAFAGQVSKVENNGEKTVIAKDLKMPEGIALAPTGKLIVAEVGDPTLVGHENNAIYRVTFDGSISDHEGYCVIGGAADDLASYLRKEYREGLSLGDALRLGRDALQRAAEAQPQVTPENLEVCVLDRSRTGRKFQRLSTDTLREHLGG